MDYINEAFESIILIDESNEIIKTNYPTLKQLFEKYKYNINFINYEPIYTLSEDPEDLKNYVIDFRNGIGEILVDYSQPYESEFDMADSAITNFPISQLLNLKVNILSWTKYSNKIIEENEITYRLYNTFFIKN